VLRLPTRSLFGF